MAIPMETKDMKFKYICKYCQKIGLAWKVIEHKWTLFEDHSTAHTCSEKKTVIDSQIANLTKKKVPSKKSGFQEHMEKILIHKGNENTPDKEKAAKDILKKIKDGDSALKAMADNPILVDDSINPCGEILLDSGNIIQNEVEETNPKSSKTKVRLIDAEELYQPVYGSSQSSTYYVVALYKGLKFAARVKGIDHGRIVSIRVEGNKYTKLKGMSGLQKFKDNGKYGSIHLNVETVYEAKMVICGLIGGLDLESLSPMPDLTNIAK